MPVENKKPKCSMAHFGFASGLRRGRAVAAMTLKIHHSINNFSALFGMLN